MLAEDKKGVIYAVMAFVMWGLAPLYFKLLQAIGPMEILVHRVLWSLVFLLLIVTLMARWQPVWAVLTKPKSLLILLLSACLLCFNWGLFIWAVNNNYVLDASLGYFINPLFNVLLGMVFLHERLNRMQRVALGLAFVGVLIQLLAFGSFPYVSFGLALSFSLYGLIRKTVAVDSLNGLLIESAMLLPLAFVYWYWFVDSASADMFANSSGLNWLFIGAGVVSTLPLLCFTAGARRIQYATIGFLQYIGPTLMFVQAVVLYNETVGVERWLTFGCIWLALGLFSWEPLKNHVQRSPIPSKN